MHNRRLRRASPPGIRIHYGFEISGQRNGARSADRVAERANLVPAYG
jgi:hypothetical protein